MAISSLATAALWAAAIMAGQQASIDGPKEIAPGDLAIFHVVGDAASLDWGLAGSDKKLFVDSARKQAAFASGTEGAFTVAVAVSTTDGAAVLLLHPFVVKRAGPPGPNPPPPGPDTIPDGKFKLEKWAYDRAVALAMPAATAARIVVELDKIVKDQSFADGQTLVNATSAALKAAGFPDNAAWRNAWVDQLKALGFEKRSLVDYRAAWLETAAGLRRVK